MIYEAIESCIRILKEECIHDARFKAELLNALRERTGNENFVLLCGYIIEARKMPVIERVFNKNKEGVAQ